MRVAIIDDEKVFLTLAKKKLSLLDGYDFDVSCHTSVNDLDEKEDYDFILLDIDMPSIDGIEYAKQNKHQKLFF